MIRDQQQTTKPKTDLQYFTTLTRYTPILYTGRGSPLLLSNTNCHSSFLCLTLSSIAYAACIYLLRHYHQYKGQPQDSPNKTLALTIVNVFMLGGLVVTFLMTQFLNPGIRNPDSIEEWEFVEGGRRYCFYCERDVLEGMRHCKECEVCIMNKDHHCQFFQKCMGGHVQNLAFKLFLWFAFCSCLTLFVSVIFCLV